MNFSVVGMFELWQTENYINLKFEEVVADVHQSSDMSPPRLGGSGVHHGHFVHGVLGALECVGCLPRSQKYSQKLEERVGLGER